FNDIFALLIDGPGIVPIPELDDRDNMAVIPGTDLPVSINTVNNILNWEYYRNNSESQTVQYDGLTSGFLGNKKTLTASATVIPCSTYHLKFAIADRGDTAFDSGVFISEIKSGTPDITAKFTSGLDYFVEKCVGISGDTIQLKLSDAVDNEQVYTVTIGGTANNPADYDLNIPDTIVFAPGQIEFNFPIFIFDDDIEEGEETITITLFRNFGCGDIEVVTTEIFIRENIQVTIEAGLDSLIACAGSGVQIEAEGANNYIWTPFDVMSDPFIANPVVESGYTGWVYVEGKIDPFTSPECIGFDSIFINSVDPEVEITSDDDFNMCLGDTITLTASTNAPNANITWDYPFGTVENQGELMTDIIPDFGFGFGQQIFVTVELGGCIARDTIEIIVDNFTVFTPLFTDTIVCQNSELQLMDNSNQQGFYGTNIEWTPTTYLIDPLDPYTATIPDGDIDYEFTATSASGACSDTFNFNIQVLPNEISIINGDSARICLGDSIDLSALFMPAGADVSWEPADLVTTQGAQTIAFPVVTTDFTVTVNNTICSASDVIRIYVDSLPFIPLDTIPIRDPYCRGEIVTFVSPNFPGYKYPMIEHEWSPSTGVQNDLTDLNLVVATDVTTTYIRTTTNGACSTMDTLAINVVDPSIVSVIPLDTSICKDGSVQLNLITVGELENIEWESDSGTFTCDDCEDPILENIGSSTTATVQADVDGCPIDALSVPISVVEYNGDISVVPDTICNFYGDELTLTANISPPPPGGIFTLVWSTTPEGENQEIIEGAVSNPIIVNLPGADGSNNPEKNINYSWTVTDMRGCTGSGGADVCVKNRFDIPNAFSPGDGDGNNDVFRLVDFGRGLEGLTPIEIEKFVVFNRWGQKVFDCSEFECATITGWDGTFNGVRQPGDTYMYYVKINYLDGNTQTYEGDLLLLR
ncbi:choice-of-anchor L domain-containing protein, partial [Saprospiraceae bacterium]|nr:choice-of-anchor L domain-containing protein [Saprospiraceae bacterium]